MRTPLKLTVGPGGSPRASRKLLTLQGRVVLDLEIPPLWL